MASERQQPPREPHHKPHQPQRASQQPARPSREGGLETKERRSSVGFFDFVKFRGSLVSRMGGVDREVAKAAEGRKGRCVFGGDDARAGMSLLFEKFQPHDGCVSFR